MIDEILNQMLQDLTLWKVLKIKSCYSEIDAYMTNIKHTLSPESNSSIEEKYLVIMDLERFSMIDRNLELKALGILEKSLEYNKSPIIGDLLCSPLDKIEIGRASDVLIKTLNVCLNFILSNFARGVQNKCSKV